MSKELIKKLAFFLFAMAVPVSLIATEIVTYSRNTLQNHPEWICGNLLLASPSMGAAYSHNTRQLLKQNRLNLQEWHGFQEVLLNKVFQLRAMKLKLRLGEDAYLCLIYNKSRDSFSGVRISRNVFYESMFFKADNDGEFLTKRSVKNLKIDNKWHEVELRFRQSELQLMWDGVLVNSVPDVSSTEQVIGFRSGGPFETIIDDVKVIDHNGNTIISESFRNSHNWWRLFFLFLVLSVLIGGLFFFAASMARVQPQTTAKWALLVQTSMSSMLLLYLCFDYCLYSNYYPYAHVQQWKSVPSELCFFENIRMRFFSLFGFFDTVSQSVKEGAGGKQPVNFLQSKDHDIAPAGFFEAQVIWEGAHGEEIRIIPIPQLNNFFNTMPLDSFYKIIFLGTSQTWGEGAASRKKQMVFQAHRYLQGMCGYNGNFLVVNAGLRAADSNAMLKILKAVFETARFEMVVVNLSNNDKPAGFKKNILEMSEVADRNKANIILVKEANNPDSDSMRLRENHRAIEEIASEKSIHCIDMQTYLSSPDIVDSGFLWWDSVHLTSYGQAIAGRAIAREIHRFASACRNSPHTVGTSVVP